MVCLQVLEENCARVNTKCSEQGSYLFPFPINFALRSLKMLSSVYHLQFLLFTLSIFQYFTISYATSSNQNILHCISDWLISQTWHIFQNWLIPDRMCDLQVFSGAMCTWHFVLECLVQWIRVIWATDDIERHDKTLAQGNPRSLSHSVKQRMLERRQWFWLCSVTVTIPQFTCRYNRHNDFSLHCSWRLKQIYGFLP